MGLLRDFPDSPVVESLPSNSGGASLTPGLETMIPLCLGAKTPKHKDGSNTVTNPIKT